WVLTFWAEGRLLSTSGPNALAQFRTQYDRPPLARAIMILCLAIFPAAWFTILSHALTYRRRVSEGRCTKCGYDLRASRDRCPECGQIAPEAQKRTALGQDKGSH